MSVASTVGTGDLGQLLLSGVEPGEDPRRVPAQREAGVGELHGSGAALDQRQPHRALQGGDVLADRGLGEGQGASCGGEAAGRVHGGEHVQAANVQHKSYY